MTVLSRLLLNQRSRQVQRDLADCRSLHQTVLSAFPSAPNAGRGRSAFGILYRVDALGDRRMVLVQSAEEPNWDMLPAGYLFAGSKPEVKPVDHLYSRLGKDQTLRFRLRANATKRLSTKAGEGRSVQDDSCRPGKRVDLRREEDQLAWLQRKAQAGGFELLTVRTARDVVDTRIVPDNAVHGWRRENDGRQRMTFGSVVFEGNLRITEAETFRQVLLSGIGSGKAYGFGLLSIAPAITGP